MIDAVVWAVAAGALLRQALGLFALGHYLVRARVASIPKGPTPPISLVKPLRGRSPGLVENLESTLRQNYPDFEVLFLCDGEEGAAAAAEAAARVPDVPVRRIGGADLVAEARHGILAVAAPAVRADPLYLRDVANALERDDAVAFVPVLFGMRGLWARLRGLLVDTEGILSILLGRVPMDATIGVRGETLERGVRMDGLLAGRRPALARRAARLFSPDGSDVAEFARALRTRAPGVYALHLLLSTAPLLLLREGGALALSLLALHTAARAAVAILVDFRFCWDRSLVRALPLLPLLWVFEPASLLAGLAGRARATLPE